MAIIDWVILGIIALGVITLVLLIGRKWKQLKLLDLEAMPKAAMRLRKYKMMEERLERKTKGALNEAKKVFKPGGAGRGRIQKMVEKLQEMERKYRHVEKAPKTQEQKEMMRTKIVQLMEKGTQAVKDQEYGEAEAVYVDVIRLDQKNVEAYQALGEVYWKKKDYDHAFETLEFAKKLDPKNDRLYYTLGQIHESRDDKEAALQNYKESVECAPKSPRNLTALIEFSLSVGEKLVARQALHQLKEANPDNNRIEEFEKQLKES